jgi:GDP/UDP-N,N'-diacetylbacillosamine 2-epimerase (hydrolysing)
MTLAVLTSSRADYGIWLPLLKAFRRDAHFNFELVVFGTHLSEKHGYTINEIFADGFKVHHRLNTLPLGDKPADISDAMGKTLMEFSEFWRINGSRYDVVLCLGDRYEMFAAVAAAAPFGLFIAHVHGGETTLGAIDNAFRHSITQFASMHFVAAEKYAHRLQSMLDNPRNIHVVGALGIDNMRELELMDTSAFQARFGFQVDQKTILFTFHPETVSPETNVRHGHELVKTLSVLEGYKVLITMPNADTYGDTLRRLFIEGLQSKAHIQIVENLGSVGYLSAMKLCAFLMGNSSSGIIEAASLGKYVVNLGTRQKGRAHGENVIDVAIDSDEILKAISDLERLNEWDGGNIYDLGGAADGICRILKSAFPSP